MGDARVNRRIVELADILVASEADSWPDKFANPADYRAFNRILNRPQATQTQKNLCDAGGGNGMVAGVELRVA